MHEFCEWMLACWRWSWQYLLSYYNIAWGNAMDMWLYKDGKSHASGEPAISLHSYTVSLVQWVNPLLPVMRDLGSIPRGVLMWNRSTTVSVVSLHSTPFFSIFSPCGKDSYSKPDKSTGGTLLPDGLRGARACYILPTHSRLPSTVSVLNQPGKMWWTHMGETRLFLIVVNQHKIQQYLN